MSDLFKIFKSSLDEGSSELYAKAEEEVEAGEIDKGLWSQALVKAKGNEQLRKVEYMKLRVLQLKRQPKRTVTIIKSISLSSPEKKLNQEGKKNDVQSAQPSKKGFWRLLDKTHEDDKAGTIWGMCITWGILVVIINLVTVSNFVDGSGWGKEDVVVALFGILSIVVFFAYLKLIKERKHPK